MFRCSIEELKHGFIVDMPRLGTACAGPSDTG